MKQVIIFDFEDSFTFNIASEVSKLGIDCQVVPYTYLFKEDINELIISDSKQVFIYGPGPGHPRNYHKCFPTLKKIIENPNIFHMGICLGHQLLLTILDGQVTHSKNPVHGRSVELTIPNWGSRFSEDLFGKSVQVQRYNSLNFNKDSIENLSKDFKYLFQFIDNELMLFSFFGLSSGISYQFHPESIGTSCPALFFAPLQSFLYNERIWRK